jgi:hypothetical protein
MNRLGRTICFGFGVASLALPVHAGQMANTAIGSPAEALAERHIARVHYRLAQIEVQRRQMIATLRLEASQRLEEQRASARLARDRLRDFATLTPRPGG